MRIIIGFLITGFLLQNAFGQEKLPEDVSGNIKNRIELGIIPSIVVGIIDKNGPRYYTFGAKTIGGEPIDEHTIYEIGSITKSFTGILLAQMALDGELRIDDPAQNFLPESVKLPVRSGVQITLGHLSDHTSGIPRRPNNYTPKNFGNPFADFGVEHLYSFLNSYTLTREIGSEFEYSNVGAGLLGHILSLKAGTSYEELIIDKISSPLEMTATRITPTLQMEGKMATGHINGKPASNWDFSVLEGAGAIRSSLHDLLRYVGANMGLIKSELYPAMQLSHQTRHNKKASGGKNGLGWAISSGAEGDIIWHNGVTGGFRAFIGFVVETGTGVVVLTNSDQAADDIGMRLLNSNAKLQEIQKPAPTTLSENLKLPNL